VVGGSAEQGSQKPTHTANCAVQGRFGMYTHLHWIYATMHGEAYTCDRCPCTGSANAIEAAKPSLNSLIASTELSVSTTGTGAVAEATVA